MKVRDTPEERLLRKGRWRSANMDVATTRFDGTTICLKLGTTNPTRATVGIGRPRARRPNNNESKQE
jgi:hypothetical protein